MKFSCRSFLLATVVVAAGPAWAGEGPFPPSSQTPKGHAMLKRGGAAGVAHAQQITSGIALMAGGGVVAIVALVASGGGGGKVPQVEQQVVPATTTTP